jgi:putative nucleotidyltransferase with HDIG domain
MERNEALNLIKEHVKKGHLIKHMLAVEAIMKELAANLGENQERWALIGLIHDIDYDKTENDPERHATMSAEILKDKIDEDAIRTIKSHNFEHTNVMPEKKIDIALIASDAISGLVIAAALVVPSKKLADVKVSSISKKFKQKDFARRCNRNHILLCEKIGVPKEKFFEISLTALQKISDELGL